MRTRTSPKPNGAKPRDRRVHGTDRMTLIVEQIPRRVVQSAREKARAKGTTLKAVVVDMLEGYGSASD